MTDDRWLIIETINRYALGYDENDMVMLGECFSENAVYEAEAGGVISRIVTGRNNITAWLGRKVSNNGHLKSRHLITNTVFISLDPDSARVISYFAAVASEPEKTRIVATGKYSDQLVKVNNSWFISKRNIALDTIPLW